VTRVRSLDGRFSRQVLRRAQNKPARFLRSEGGLRSLRDQLAFVLSQRREQSYRQGVGFRHVAGDELRTTISQDKDEGNATGQAIELCNDKRRPLALRVRDRLGELRS
jgi:hypothetical protein